MHQDIKQAEEEQASSKKDLLLMKEYVLGDPMRLARHHHRQYISSNLKAFGASNKAYKSQSFKNRIKASIDCQKLILGEICNSNVSADGFTAYQSPTKSQNISITDEVLQDDDSLNNLSISDVISYTLPVSVPPTVEYRSEGSIEQDDSCASDEFDDSMFCNEEEEEMEMVNTSVNISGCPNKEAIDEIRDQMRYEHGIGLFSSTKAAKLDHIFTRRTSETKSAAPVKLNRSGAKSAPPKKNLPITPIKDTRGRSVVREFTKNYSNLNAWDFYHQHSLNGQLSRMRDARFVITEMMQKCKEIIITERSKKRKLIKGKPFLV
jgi:hypothetical protein